MSLDELYQELLLDHFKNPRCQGCLSDPSSHSHVFNPLCGDQIALTIKCDGHQLRDLAFTGHGCSISQASASMMAELCKGKTLQEARTLLEMFRSMMRGEEPQKKEVLGDVLALEGVRKFSARIKCALLGWEALERCLDEASPGSKSS
jgi:nitrogen fixation NifU-like protein